MLRLVDVNLNRAREGLRVLEDIARFLLNDGALMEEFRRLRHNLVETDPQWRNRLLSAREATTDPGARAEAGPRSDLPGLVMANARRVEESLRALEEFARLPQFSPPLSAPRFQEARFTLYTLEKELLSRLLRRSKLERLTGLYVIIDPQVARGRSEIEIARQAIRGGARVIQLRDKEREHGALLPIALELRAICANAGVLFIINDHLDLALACQADGLHLGQGDLPIPAARRLLPVDVLLGASTHSPEQALAAQEQGADYIGVGSVFPTATKEAPILVGVDMIQQIKAKVSLPIVAIGGINQGNVAQVMAAGASAAAVISAVAGAEDIEEAARQIVSQMGLRKE